MQILLFVLAFLSIAITQVLIGGKDLALCLPGYGFLSLAGLFSVWTARRWAIPRGATDCLTAAGVFFAYVAIRALFSPEEYLGRADLYVALGAATLYLLISLHLTSSRLRGLFVAGLLLLALANCVVGAIQFAKGDNFMPFDFLSRSDYGSRISGFYRYPNHLAVFLEVTLMLGLGVTCWSGWPPWARVVAGYGSLVCAGGIVLTGSRGGYFSSLAGLLVFGSLSLWVVRRFAFGRAISLIAVGSLIVGALGWGGQHFLAKSSVFHERAELMGTTDTVRLRLWQAAWEQFKIQPIVGTGSGTSLYYGRQFRDPAIQTDPVHAHNEYLEFLAEYGILGMAVAMMFLDSHLRNGWKALSKQISRQSDALAAGSDFLALTLGALSAAAACVVHSAMDFSLHMPANMLVMAFVFALLATPEGTAKPVVGSEEDDLGFLRYIRLALPALGLWVAVRALPTLPAEYFVEKARAVISDGQYAASEEITRSGEAIARRGLAWDARNPELHFSLGTLQAALAAQFSADPAVAGEWSAKSLASYKAALELAPGDVRFVLAVASSLQGAGRFSEAEVLFERAAKRDPNSSNVRYVYADHLRRAGKLAEAESQYQKTIKLGGGPQVEAELQGVIKELKIKRSIEARVPGQ